MAEDEERAFVCRKDCHWKKLWRKGESALAGRDFPANETPPPEFFAPAGEITVPEPVKPAPPKAGQPIPTLNGASGEGLGRPGRDPLAGLREKARAMGVPAGPNWGEAAIRRHMEKHRTTNPQE